MIRSQSLLGLSFLLLVAWPSSWASQVCMQMATSPTTLPQHPGIASRAKHFAEFLRANPVLHSKKSEEVVAAYREHLGYVTLYRAVNLSDKELSIVHAQGLAPNYQRNYAASDAQATKLFLEKGLAVTKERHVDMFGLEDSPVMSFSTDKIISQWVVKHDAAQTERKRYVFKVRVPVIDIVYIDSYKTTDVIIEALVVNTIPPSSIMNLNSAMGETENVNFMDLADEFRHFRQMHYIDTLSLDSSAVKNSPSIVGI